MIITDEAGQGIRQFTLSHVPALVLVYSVFALSLVILCFMIYAGIYIHRSSSMKRELTAQVAHLTSENKKLSKENSELHDEADQLMVAVNNYRSAEEKAAKTEEEMKIPSGFPLSSSAQMKAGKDNPNGTGKKTGKKAAILSSFSPPLPDRRSSLPEAAPFSPSPMMRNTAIRSRLTTATAIFPFTAMPEAPSSKQVRWFSAETPSS